MEKLGQMFENQFPNQIRTAFDEKDRCLYIYIYPKSAADDKSGIRVTALYEIRITEEMFMSLPIEQIKPMIEQAMESVK